MTSKSYPKSYRRKTNAISSTSIQFDKLLHENSNRPTPLKSAGTVGKWGITSFTSIRSVRHSSTSSEELQGSNNKRMKMDYASPQREEVFVYNQQPEQQPVVKLDANRPKKFFKSRNVVEQQQQPLQPAVEEVRSNVVAKPRRQPKQQQTNNGSHNKSTDSSIINKEDGSSPSKDESKPPPIVLRICKGTAKIISLGDERAATEEVVQQTAEIESPKEKKTRRKSLQKEISHCVKENEPATLVENVDQVDSSEMRTTRSRAKKLTLNITTTEKISVVPRITSPLKKSGLRSKYIPQETKTEYTSSEAEETFEKMTSDKPLEVEENLSRLAEAPTSWEEQVPQKKTYERVERKRSLRSSSTQEVPEEKKPEAKPSITTYECFVKRDIRINENEPLKAEPLIIKTSSIEQDWSCPSDEADSINGARKQPSSSKNAAASEVKTGRKGSIFKSRNKAASPGKRRALYKHKWSGHDRDSKSTEDGGAESNLTSKTLGSSSETPTYIEEAENIPLTRVTNYPSENPGSMDDFDEGVITTSVHCGKDVKGFYTVVKNVKKAHQIQESGEFQEFNDDVEYILDTLREDNPNATRCLSAISLASKCMAPAFRMHVRAHGTVAKFFKALQDSTKDQSLALCTATVMFVLSQDRLAMDLDRDCLELMLNLLESDASHKNALEHCGLSQTELLKNKEKVRQLCSDIQAQGHAQHLNLDNITVGQLAMETLLSLTSKRAGEWFKEELRELGGLEHIIKTIKECHRHIVTYNVEQSVWEEHILDKLKKVDRCLRVLENVTHMNEENQIYLLKYNDNILVKTLANLYHIGGREIMSHPTYDMSDKSSTGFVIRECLFAVLKVLINLSHRFNARSEGDLIVGSQENLISNSLKLVLVAPRAVPEEKKFDVMMLALILLINLIEKCEDNRNQLFLARVSYKAWDSENTVSGLESLVNVFYGQEELAQEEEQKTDAILDGKKDEEQDKEAQAAAEKKSQAEFIEETVAKLLQKAGRHMEHTLIAAYVVLLIGNLIIDNTEYEAAVRSQLREGTFIKMIDILQKFFNFMNLTASNEASTYGIAATEKIIKFLKASDIRTQEEANDTASGMSDDSVNLGHSIS